MPSSDPSFDLNIKQLQQFIQQGATEQSNSLSQEILSLGLSTEQKTQVLYLQAVSLRLQKEHNKALKSLDSLSCIAPSHARMHQEKGYNFRALGDIRSAATHFYLASKYNPALLSAWQALLPIYGQQGQSEASKLCQTQINHLSGLPKPILAATDLLYEGNVSSADQVCRAYLREHKHSLPGLLLLAEIATKLRAISEAEFILETCVELAPNDLEAKYQLFKIYSKLGKFALALALAEQLTQHAKDNMFYRVAQATALVGVGEIEKAINIYNELIESNKAESNVHLLLGHAHKTNANIDKAVSAYKQAYQLERYCGDAYWSLANTKTYRFSAAEIAEMLVGTKNETINIDTRIHLHFALGKALEDNQDYGESFNHYAQGNALKASQISYSQANHSRFIQHQIECFTPEFKQQIEGLGHFDNSPIFILGMPRAGSTLLEQILASHSQVDGTMELHEILGLAARLSKSQKDLPAYPANLNKIPKNLFAEFGQQFIKTTQIYRQAAPYFIDKMPNNFMHIGLIKSILPNAKIIDARRDPMGCCFSGFKQLFGEGQEFSYSLKDIGQYYKEYVRLMAHWQQIFPNQILQVNHADMVNDTEHQIKRMLDFCGLEFEQNCVDFHKNKRAVKTPSAEQVRQPIYKSGLAQWKHFAPYLDELKATLG